MLDTEWPQLTAKLWLYLFFPTRSPVCKLTRHSMCAGPQQESHLIQPCHWVKGCDWFWVSKFFFCFFSPQMYVLSFCLNNAHYSQAPNAQRPVVDKTSSIAKNVGQVPNQLLWICPWRDWTCDSTLDQHRLRVLSFPKAVYFFSPLSIRPFLHRTDAALHVNQTKGFQSQHWSHMFSLS